MLTAEAEGTPFTEESSRVDLRFGDLVRAIRHYRQLTQEQLADKTNVSARTIANIERGDVRHPHRQTVRLLADGLGLAGGARRGFEATAHRAYWRALLDDGVAGPVEVEPSSAQRGPGQADLEVPHQLPVGPAYFVGRDDELTGLGHTVFPHSGAGPTVVLITGTAGVGKTAFAVRWAREIVDRFPDGQLYVNLQGFGRTGVSLSPTEVLRGFLESFGVPQARIPTSLVAQTGLYRSLLADRRVLVLLDNACDLEQVRPLLPGSSGCLAIVTSRMHLAGLVAVEGAVPLRLDPPSVAEARRLIVRRLGADRVHAEPAAVEQIIGKSARLPLALAIVAARVAGRPTFPLADLAAELAGAGVLDALHAGDTDTDIRTAFSWSYQALTTTAAELFRLLGLHPGPDITLAATASLGGMTPKQARTVTAELANAHLLTEPSPGRYALQDLLRTYAAELARLRAEETASAVHRLIDHYTHSAHAAVLAAGYPAPVALTRTRPGVSPERPVSREAAVTWLTSERPTLLAIVQLATDTGLEAHARRLAWLIDIVLEAAPAADDQGSMSD
ncbi:helix-turn-helix domain-containing protein [Flindersiella endophytica]